MFEGQREVRFLRAWSLAGLTASRATFIRLGSLDTIPPVFLSPICAPFLGRYAELERLPAQALCIGDDPVGGYQCAVDAVLQYFLADSASLHKNFSGWLVEVFGSLTTVLC